MPSPSSYAAWIERHYTGLLIVWTVVERWQRSDGIHAVASLQKHGFKVAMLFQRNRSTGSERAKAGRSILKSSGHWLKTCVT